MKKLNELQSYLTRLRGLMLTLIILCSIGIGNAWGAAVASQAPANGKSFIIALYYNSTYYALPANLTNTGVTPAGLACTLDANNKVSAISTCDTPDECLWYFETATGGYNISYVDAEDVTRYLYKNGTIGNNYNISANPSYKTKSVWAFTSGTANSVTAYSMKTTKSDATKHTVIKAKNNTSFQVNGTSNSYSVTLLEVAPRITCATTSLSGFTYVQGSGPSAAQSFSVSGSHLTANITVTAPTNYEVSTSSGSGYGSSVTLTKNASGVVSATTVYVRLKSGLSVNTYSESISIASTGATTKSITLSGSVTAPASTWKFKYSGDSWTEHTMTESAGTASYSISLAADSRFEFGIDDNGTFYKNSGTIITTTSGWVFNTSDNNCKIHTGPAGTYTFAINTTSKAVTVTYPTVDHPNDHYVYFKNTNVWGTVYGYLGNSGNDNKAAAWPGSVMQPTTTICGETYHYAALNAMSGTYNTIIFNNGNSGYGNQTSDLSTTGSLGKYNANQDANWHQFKYSISFEGNGNTGGSMSEVSNICPGSDQTLAPNGFTKTNYNFTGWVADVDVKIGGSTVTAGTLIANAAAIQDIQSNITLTAQWVHVPEITASETARAFDDRKVNGGPYNMTFNVSGQYLTGNINLAITGTNAGMFSVNKTSLTPSTGTVATTEITVSYSPTGAGSHTATLTISSDGATSKTVALSGTGKWEVVWSVNGGETTSLVANGTKPTLPSPAPSSCDATSTTFMGWATSSWPGKLDDVSDKTIHTSNSTMDNVTANGTTFYAVFAKASGSGGATYKKVTSGLSDYSGQYLIVFETDNICFDGSRSIGQSNTNLDASGNYKSVVISTSTNPYSIASTSTIDTYSFTISASQTSGKYYIQSASGYYIGSTNTDNTRTGSNELLINTSTTYDNSISVLSGNATITGANNILKCFKQSGQSDRFRYFKTTAGNVNPIQLYKYDPGITYSNYMTTCCENKVTLNTGSPSNGTVAFSPTGPIATCSSTASERQTTVTVTPNTGYKLTGWTKAVSGIALPDSTSAISTSSGNTAAQSNTYTFAQNANGSMTVTATFSPILVSSLKLKATQTGESDKIGNDLTMTCYPKEGQTGGNDPLNHSLNIKFHEVLPANALDKEYDWSVRVKATGAADWTNVDFTGNQLNTNAIINYYNNNTGLLKIGTNEGTAEIKITANDASGVSAKVTITVAKVSVTSISVDPTSMNVYAGQKKPVTITFTPLNASDKAYTTGSYSYVTIRSSGSNPFYIEGNATEVVHNETVTVTSHDGSHTATIAVTVNPLPKATFVDIVQNKTDFVGVPSTGILSSTVDEGGLTVTTTKNTPTHADVAKPATGNNCEKEHLHLVGWILKDWADENPDATSAQIAAAGAGYFYTAGAEIDLVAKDGKTFYAVWAKEVTTP